MSRKRKNHQLITVRRHSFVVVDSHTGQRVIVAAPVLYQLIRRGWAGQVKVSYRRETTEIQIIVTEEHAAVLVDRLSFHSLKPAPNGNLCFRSLLVSDGASIESSWRAVERAWTLQIKPKDFVPQTWQGKIAVQEMRTDAIWDECSTWGILEPEPIRTGRYLSPEDAALAIAARNRESLI